jgi:serine phosphatase RsbU (regulator of sigma subunit)
MTKPATPPPDRLATSIAAIQEGFRTLSQTATVKDLSARFTGVLRMLFPGDTIGLYHRADDALPWNDLTSQGESVPADFFSTGADPRDLRVTQRLPDHSSLALRLLPAGGSHGADILSLRVFVLLFDNAYRGLLSRRYEKELIFSLNHRVLQLNSLIDTGISLSKLDGHAPPHHLALERAAALTNAARGIVSVATASGPAERYVFPAGADDAGKVDPARTISTAFMFEATTYTLVLFDKESRSGVGPFDETDQLLLDALARQVQASLENRYLHAQALEKLKIEQDIAVAASIQQRILPHALPAIDGYDLAGINIPSKSVGGDYYDCIPIGGGKFALVIADVAGKGVPAALLVSSLHAYLTAYLESPIAILDLARRLNRVICRASTDDKFITAFLAVLDPITGALESLSAGHNPVFLLRAGGKLQELALGGVPFGMLDMDFPYQSEKVELHPGDRLLLYTDGVTEATNEQNELYDTVVPLKQFVTQRATGKAQEFITALIADIKKFTGSAPQNDDITALYLTRR